MKWNKQRLLAERHNRRQYETVIELADANKETTFVAEWVMEDNSLLISEDNTTSFITETA